MNNAPVVLDLETKKSLRDVGHDLGKIGISLVGIYNYTIEKFSLFREEELFQLFPILESASLIIGYNIRKFDLPVLSSYYIGKIQNFSVLDLLEDIEKVLGFRVALDVVAKETLGVRKTGHGLKAIEYYKSGQWKELEDYCLTDVRITKEVYEYGKKEGKVYIKDVKGQREIPVDWVNLNQRNNIPLTLPL